jgi:hypothetical protein
MNMRYQDALRTAARTTVAFIASHLARRARWHARSNQNALRAAVSGADLYSRGFSSVERS